MPKARDALNGFTPKQTAAISGLSIHMLNYLSREGYLRPSHSDSRTRGVVRYYSFRDLVVARIVERLLAAGLEIRKLKLGIKSMSSLARAEDNLQGFKMLVTDGKDLFYVDRTDSVISLTSGGQYSFAFVLDIQAVREDVQRDMSAEQREIFNVSRQKLKFL